MSNIRSFIKREPVLIISVIAALISCFFVMPDAKYIDYIDLRTLALLYSLMIVVAGLRKAGVFTSMAQALCVRARSTRTIGIMLVCLCFFTSMFITNDVALLTFVPFSIIVLSIADRMQDIVRVVVLQTVAANLGSMLTPIGNPQNLHLYSFYTMSFTDFILATLPVWILSFILLIGCCFFLPNSRLTESLGGEKVGMERTLWIYLALFIVCLLTVIRIINWYIMLPIIVVVLLIFDRKILLKADFMLLLTFVAFFIFAGNLARIDAISSMLSKLLSGREYFTSLLASQVISNVPAALLLSGFTSNAKAILLGVNIGGLGTPIASLASLISLKLYSRTDNAKLGRFLLEFTIVNVVLLVLLSVFYVLIG